MSPRVALVTGGSRGIGRAVAVRLSACGHAVALTYREREAAARDVVKEIEARGGEAVALPYASGCRASARALLRAVQAQLGEPDVLVNNAAVLHRTPFEGIGDEEFAATLSANLQGPFQLSQECAPAMRRRGFGRIVNLASVGGQTGGTLALHYAASKAALVSLTRSLARLLAPHGVTCNAVSPGLVATEMIEGELASEAGRAKLAAVPVGRTTTPEEVAALVAFLAGDEAATITGQTLNVNGGLYLG